MRTLWENFTKDDFFCNQNLLLKNKKLLLGSLIVLHFSVDAFSQCNAAWPTVSGANQTISVNSRVPTGSSLTGTLTVNAGITLCTEGTAAINVSTLTNNGTINHTGSGTFTASSTVINSGTITSTSSAFIKSSGSTAVTNNAGASFTIFGNVQLEGDLTNNGSITSSTGTFTHTASTAYFLTNNAGASITAAGNIATEGVLTNSGTITSTGGTFTKASSGNVNNTASTATITASGSVQIEGNITNSGTISSSGGTFTHSNASYDVTNNAGATIQSAGNILMEGDVINNSTITSNAGGFTHTASTAYSLTNNTNASITVAGNIATEGPLTNSGTITSTGGTFTKAFSSNVNNSASNSSITVPGNIQMEGNITNSGDIISTTGTFTHSNASYDATNNIGSLIQCVGNIQMEGDITNTGSIITTTGTFTHTASTAYSITNLSGGVIQVYGNIATEGQINNCGTIEITNSGTLTKTSGSGSITNSAGSTILIRGSGLTSQIEGNFTNNGRFKTEGRFLKNTASFSLTNSSSGYFRVCEEFSHAGDITNSGTMEILGRIFMGTSAAYSLTNNSGGVLNVTDDIDIIGSLYNYGCITVGDLVWKKVGSSDITISGGTLFTTNFIQDDGNLSGSGTAVSRGFLRVSGSSQTLNGVPLSGYLDIRDAGHSGVAPYFDVESPSAYTYLTGNITDNAFSPGCTQATLIACGDALPAASGSCSVLLPVELLFFKANCDLEKVKITWATASETNNHYFTIERSDDGIHYHEIGTVNGAGNSNTFIMYSFTDNLMDLNSKQGIVFYRLSQTDFDGATAVFDPVSLNIRCSSGIFITPTLSEGMVYIHAYDGFPPADIHVFDALGRRILSKNTSEEWFEQELNLNHSAKGMYTVVIRSAEKLITQKIILW